MKELKFCCDKFEIEYKLFPDHFPHIRIEKFIPEKDGKEDFPGYYKDGKYKKTSRRRKKLVYVFNLGYKTWEDMDAGKPPMTLEINFCPYCGKNLSKYYNKLSYINTQKNDEILL